VVAVSETEPVSVVVAATATVLGEAVTATAADRALTEKLATELVLPE
jgi:hypothetical protein